VRQSTGLVPGCQASRFFDVRWRVDSLLCVDGFMPPSSVSVNVMGSHGLLSRHGVSACTSNQCETKPTGLVPLPGYFPGFEMSGGVSICWMVSALVCRPSFCNAASWPVCYRQWRYAARPTSVTKPTGLRRLLRYSRRFEMSRVASSPSQASCIAVQVSARQVTARCRHGSMPQSSNQ
jgi:hypothetical protein